MTKLIFLLCLLAILLIINACAAPPVQKTMDGLTSTTSGTPTPATSPPTANVPTTSPAPGAPTSGSPGEPQEHCACLNTIILDPKGDVPFSFIDIVRASVKYENNNIVKAEIELAKLSKEEMDSRYNSDQPNICDWQIYFDIDGDSSTWEGNYYLLVGYGPIGYSPSGLWYDLSRSKVDSMAPRDRNISWATVGRPIATIDFEKNTVKLEAKIQDLSLKTRWWVESYDTPVSNKDLAPDLCVTVSSQVLNIPISDELKLMIATIYGEAASESEASWEAIANVIMNRVGKREWKELNTVSKVIIESGFDAYTHPNAPYQTAIKYLANRDGSNAKIERLITITTAVYNRETKDITGSAVLYYSPMAQKALHERNPSLYLETPDWNFSMLREVKVPGTENDDFKFYKYK